MDSDAGNKHRKSDSPFSSWRSGFFRNGTFPSLQQKELIWVENSAHFPCFEETEKFNKLMVTKVLDGNKIHS